MRILILPMYSAPLNLNSCSSRAMIKILAHHFLDEDPECFIHWVFPDLTLGKNDGYGRWVYEEEEGVFDHPRIERIDIPMIAERYLEWTMYTRELHDHFSQLHSAEFIGYDAIITERPIGWPVIYHSLAPHVERKDSKVPTFIRDPFVQGYGTGRDMLIRTADVFLQSVGYAMPDTYTQFYSKSDFDLAIATAERFLMPAMVKEIKARSQVIPGGTNIDEILAAKEKYRSLKNPFEVYVSVIDRWSGHFHSAQAIRAIHTLYCLGKKVKGWLCTLSSDFAANRILGQEFGEDWKTALAHMDFSWRTPRHAFVKRIVQGDVIICLAERHSYPQGLMEAVAAGLIPIMPDLPWARAIMPEGYPWLLPTGRNNNVNTDEVTAMLAEVVDNVEDIKAELRLDEWVRDNFSARSSYARLQKWIYDTVYEHERRMWKAYKGERLRELVRNTAASLRQYADDPTFTTEEFEKAARYLSRTGNFTCLDERKDGGFATNPYQIKLLLRILGWFDSCQGPRPRFVEKVWGEWAKRGFTVLDIEQHGRDIDGGFWVLDD